MKVISANRKAGYFDDFRNFLDFKRFEKDCGDFVFMEAIFESTHNWDQFEWSEKYLNSILKKHIVRLEIEEPNKLFLPENPDSIDRYFDVIYTICPYTAEWLNKRQGNKKRVPIYYPTNEKYIPKKSKKIYDVVYIGNLVSNRLLSDIDAIKNFNYKWVSFSKHPLVTDTAVTYTDKLKLLSQSKVAIVHNVLMLRPYHVFILWTHKDWQKNKAFKFVPTWKNFWKAFGRDIVVPQAKTRLFESALSRTLILCKKDPFNIIERYFEPGKEFVYYKEGELQKTLDQVLGNYGKYQKIIDRAYKRAKTNYTTQAFVKQYLSKLEFPNDTRQK